MSRILRRPMFRGGRVDARGTGIASGLGYAGGGSVNTPKRGLVNEPGGYAGIPQHKTGAEIMEEVYAKPWLPYLGKRLPPDSVGTTDTGKARGVNTTDEFIPVPERIIRGQVTGGGMKKNPNYRPPTQTVEIGRNRVEHQVPISKEEILFTDDDHPGQIMNSSEAEIYAPPPPPPEKTKAEKLAEYQEMFEEAYGSGRGEDISNMLLSFAGKALKPEATVKSSFGEFFEEEGKRPSERKKYKDAATTAAINAFLTGEKTIAETEAFMNRTDYTNAQKLAIVEKAQRGWSMNDFVLNRDKGETKSEALEGGARKKVDFGQYKDFKKIKSKQNDEKLLIEESVGIIFLDEGTREVFTIIIGEDGTPAKQILYGV